MKGITILLAFALAGCTQADRATELLHQQGYTDVQITGYNGFACGRDDTYATGFTATNPAGNRVSGTVCAGLFFKGATIRF